MTLEREAVKLKWDIRWLQRAIEHSTWSKDPAAPVGCALVDEVDKVEIIGGYNGFPRNVKDDDRLMHVETKNEIIVHAEMNAVCLAARRGVSVAGATAYITRPPCSTCACLLIQAGIARVVWVTKDLTDSKWKKSTLLGIAMLKEAGVRVYELGSDVVLAA